MDQMEVYVNYFSETFFGNQEKYVVHKPPFITKGSKTKAEKVSYAKVFKKNIFKRVEDKVIRSHLAGEYGVAFEPLIPAEQTSETFNQCLFSVIDIDFYVSNPLSYIPLLKGLKEVGLNFFSVFSKSNGLHIFFTFSIREKAEEVVKTMKRIVTVFGIEKAYKKGNVSCVEIFPLKTSSNGNGKCIMLPYFNAKNGKPLTKCITEEGKLLSIENGVQLMNDSRTSLSIINQVLDDMKFNDAPYCVSAILHGRHNINQRNSFLFHSAVYLSKKNEGEVKINDLLEIDSYLRDPLQHDFGGENEINSIAGSINKKTYEFTCRNDPMSTFCDKNECVKRLISGVRSKKRNDNSNTGVEFLGALHRYKGVGWSYYEWEIKPEKGDVKIIRFDNELALLDQRKLQALCIQHGNFCPSMIRQDMWVDVVNKALQGIEERETIIEMSIDNSVIARFRFHLIRYLLCYIDSSDLIGLFIGKACITEEGCYFTIDGLMAYIASIGLKMSGINIHSELRHANCRETTVSMLSNSSKEPIEISCWFREKDSMFLEGVKKQKLIPEVINNDVEEFEGNDEFEGSVEELGF